MPVTLTPLSQTWDASQMLLFLGTLNKAIRKGKKKERQKESRDTWYTPSMVPHLDPISVAC